MNIFSKSRTSNFLLLLTLLFFTVALTYFVATTKQSFSLIVPIAIMAIGVAALTILFPIIGFYTAIISSFFIFDILRFIDTDLPIVTSIDILIYLTFVGILVNKIRNREAFWQNCKSPVLFMYLIIIAYFIIEFFNPNGGSKQLYFLMFRRFMTLQIFLYCSVQLFKDYNSILWFFKIFLFFSSILAVYACYEKWFGLPAFELNYILADPARIALSSLDNGEFRISSFLAGCTDFGLLMSATSVIVLSLLLSLKKVGLIKRGLLFIVLVLMFLGMSYSGTRTATVMIIVEAILYILATITNPKTLIFACCFLLLFTFIILAPSYGNATLNRLKSTFQFTQDESLNVRDQNRHYIQPYIYSHPIGGGVATTGVMNYKYNVGHPLAGFPTDSGLLSIVLEFGWIGLVIQCLIYFLTLQQGIHGYYRSKNQNIRPFYIASVTCLFGFIFAQYSQIAIGQLPSGFLYFGLTAVIIRLRQIDVTDKKLSSSLT